MSPEDTEFAGEYVLRVLPDEAHRAAAARAAADPAFAAEVRFWEERLSSLTDDIMPVVPQAASKAAVMGRLFGVDEKVGFFQKLGLWKGLTATLAAAAAALAIMAFAPQYILPAPERFVSTLSSETGTFQLAALYDRGTETLQITRTAGTPSDGRVFELWCIVEGKKTWSVGVLTADQTASLSLPAKWLDGGTGWSIAISEEAPGGSATGEPTSELIAIAEMVAI